jgi:hypothetical protein
MYAPEATAYHKHRATAGTGETLFLIEHVERNRMAMVLTHFPLHTVVSELVYFTLRFGFTTLKFVVFQFRDNLERAGIWRRRYEGRKAAYLFIMRSMPRLLVQRIKMQMNWPIDYRKMDKMFY